MSSKQCLAPLVESTDEQQDISAARKTPIKIIN